MTEPILQVKDLSVYYNKKKALNSVSLDFAPKEITALIGPSGSGKSTLLKAINRMGDLNHEVTTTGTILYNGHNIYGPRTDTVELRKEIGMVFQQPNPFPMSIYDNVTYGLMINGVKDKAVLDEAVETSLKRASIWDEVKDRGRECKTETATALCPLRQAALRQSSLFNSSCSTCMIQRSDFLVVSSSGSVWRGFLRPVQRLFFWMSQLQRWTRFQLGRLKKPCMD